MISDIKHQAKYHKCCKNSMIWLVYLHFQISPYKMYSEIHNSSIYSCFYILLVYSIQHYDEEEFFLRSGYLYKTGRVPEVFKPLENNVVGLSREEAQYHRFWEDCSLLRDWRLSFAIKMRPDMGRPPQSFPVLLFSLTPGPGPLRGRQTSDGSL